MMFYCSECRVEYVAESVLPDCPVCGATKIGSPPTFFRVSLPETVAQWEKRRGVKYPDTAPVYGRKDDGLWYLRRRENAGGLAEPFVADAGGLRQ